jgi:hypothetical protein
MGPGVRPTACTSYAGLTRLRGRSPFGEAKARVSITLQKTLEQTDNEDRIDCLLVLAALVTDDSSYCGRKRSGPVQTAPAPALLGLVCPEVFQQDCRSRLSETASLP